MLAWEGVQPTLVGRTAFNIWTSAPTFEWAEQASKLRAGLWSYENECERHVVIARFLALASGYREWCAVEQHSKP
jgi:hypothetical protein